MFIAYYNLRKYPFREYFLPCAKPQSPDISHTQNSLVISLACRNMTES